MQETTTHVLVKHRSVDQEDLYRADGMLVASRQQDIVRFGSDISTAQNRPFLNAELASKFVRRMADVDLIAQKEGKPLHAVIDGYPSFPVNSVIEDRDLEAIKNLILPAAIRFKH